MSNPIQSIRNVYDVVKSSRDNSTPLSDDMIKMLLKSSVKDEELIKKYQRFADGYAAEDLFMLIYSLLPWVKLITPLGQEQFPADSKEELQVSDYEVMYEIGDEEHISYVLVEVKLVDGDKQTQELKKYQLEVLQEYAEKKNMPLLFALFWRKHMVWTVVPIDAYEEKSSSYKISFEKALSSDVSAIFGDYTYVFQDEFYRKSVFSSKPDVQSEYVHSHQDYGRTIYDGLSADGVNFSKLEFFETPVLDCAFDFEEEKVSKKEIGAEVDSEAEADSVAESETESEAETKNEVETKVELLEKIDKLPYYHRLSRLMLGYLLKVYCYDKSDMYVSQNAFSENAFTIVDVVRQKCLGKRHYIIPDKNDTAKKLMYSQFGKVSWIIDTYEKAERKAGELVVVSHDKPEIENGEETMNGVSGETPQNL